MAGILSHEQQLAFRLRARSWRLVDIAREIGCTAPMVGLMSAMAGSPPASPTCGNRAQAA